MQLENDLRFAEEDIGSFIQSQKKSLMEEKLQLHKNKQVDGNGDLLKLSSQRKNLMNMARGSDGFGLKIGGREDKQKMLRDERQNEYRLYLEEQSMRHNHNKMSTETESQNNRNQVAQKHGEKKDFKSNIDKEYENILKNKKNEETLYRIQFNGTDGYSNNNGGKSGKKTIEFESDDDELFKFVLRQKAKSRQHSAARVQSTKIKNGYVEDGRSSSVPLPMEVDLNIEPTHTTLKNAQNKQHKEVCQQTSFNYVDNGKSSSAPPPKVPYIFGGSSHAMIRKERNKEYKEALEEQIKANQTVKYREKLKKMGKITSDMDIADYERSLNKPKKAEKITQYSHQNIAPDTSNVNNTDPDMSVVSQSKYPTNQNNYPMNPMFNPMMNYNLASWPMYGAMMSNGFVPNNMMGYQQMPTNMQEMNFKRTKTISSRGQRDDPENIEATEKVISAYVPSAVDKNNNSKPTVQNPGTMLTMMSPSDPDHSAKRAQQMVYQEELRKQMEIKKASAKKDKMANMAYEMKLEREIANYDPWGKSGCGAPVRNDDGTIIADLKKFMHQSKDHSLPPNPTEGLTNQDQLPEDLSPLLRALELSQKAGEFTDSDKNLDDVSKSGNNATTYMRGAALKELQGQIVKSPREKTEQDNYKKFLQNQVEERKRKEDELKEQALLEEQKENKRLADQQQRMLEEYQHEQEKQRKKEEDIRKQNEALRLLAEQKRYEETRKRNEVLEDREADRKMEGQMKLAEMSAASNHELTNLKVDPIRSNSPPVPAITTKSKRKKDKNYKQNNAVLLVEKTDSEKSVEYLNTIRDNLKHGNKDQDDNVEEQKHLIRQLSALRKQLQNQEKRVKTDLQKNKEKYTNLVSSTEWSEHPKKSYKRNAFDRATNITTGRKHHMAKQQFQDPIHNDYSDYGQRDFDSQQQKYMRQQELRLLALRQSVDERTSEFQMNQQYGGSKQSLLESDSKFVSLDDNEEIKIIKSGNNSKRKHYKEKLHENNNLTQKVLDESNTADTTSISTLQVEDIARRNEERLASLEVEEVAKRNGERLEMLKGNNNTSGEDLDDETTVANFMQNK